MIKEITDNEAEELTKAKRFGYFSEYAAAIGDLEEVLVYYQDRIFVASRDEFVFEGVMVIEGDNLRKILASFPSLRKFQCLQSNNISSLAKLSPT